MFKNSKIVKKIGAGFMAGLCTISMLTTAMSGVITAHAASETKEEVFPSADKVIAQAATLLGSPYAFGCKGYTGIYYQDSYKPLETDFVRNQGIDCSGLVYYTLTHLGYSTTGFSWNNPVPVDTAHWLSVNDQCTITYDGVTSKVDVEKKKISTEERPYWECADGSTITPGSVVVAEMPSGIDHAWIYMGEFDSRAEVVTYLKNIGVDESLITTATVGNGNGDGGRHWRIESNGSQGVVINNNTDGKKASVMNMYAYRITQTDVQFKIRKINVNTGAIIGESPVDNSTAVYGVYSDKNCTDKVAEIKIGANGIGMTMLPLKVYYVKEIKAPTGYALDETVYTLTNGDTMDLPEDYLTGTIRINKTAEDGIVGGREFKVVGSDKKNYTSKTNASGIAEFTDLPVYDMTTGTAITYTISEINVDTRYETPKAQNVTLTSGTVDLTVTANFVNELKTGSIRINKQSEDNQNGDRTFTITGNGETYTITTGADGIAILSDIPVYNSENEKIEYIISEKDVPIRYVVPANQTATLTADATVDVTFDNVLKKFTVEVVKKDIENGTAQGDASYPDAIGWIYVPDTNINYPIMQGEDNDFYLTHGTDGRSLKCGCIELDFRCENRFQNNFNILYGHNMKNGSMFANVCRFKEKSYYDSHPYGWVYTADSVYRLDFFSVAVTDWHDEIYNGFRSLDEWTPHLKEISRIYEEVGLTEQDRLVLLSTCSYEFDNARTVLTGRLVEMEGDMNE